MGERTPENGFVEGYVIQGGRLVEDYGGAVSTITTAMWHTAFFAGMTRIEQRAHSYWISRYVAGLEATVSWGTLDLKFRNDTPYGVYITSSVTDTSVTTTMWSTKYWDIEAEFGPRENLRSPGTVYDSSAECVAQYGVDGFDITVTRVWSRDGEVERRERLFTSYDAAPTVICAPEPSTDPKPDDKPSDKPNDKPSDKHGQPEPGQAGRRSMAGGGWWRRLAAGAAAAAQVLSEASVAASVPSGTAPTGDSGEQAVGELLAPFHAPLVEGVDAPREPGHRRGVLVEGDEGADAVRAQVGQPDQGAGPVAGHHLVRHECGLDAGRLRAAAVWPSASAAACASRLACSSSARSLPTIERTPIRSTGTRWVPWWSSWKKACCPFVPGAPQTTGDVGQVTGIAGRRSPTCRCSPSAAAAGGAGSSARSCA